jgi:hypothetical protein
MNDQSSNPNQNIWPNNFGIFTRRVKIVDDFFFLFLLKKKYFFLKSNSNNLSNKLNVYSIMD